MSDENKKDTYIITVREITTYLVAGVLDADQAEKAYNDKKSVKLQSQKNVAVAPRTVPVTPDDTPKPNTAKK